MRSTGWSASAIPRTCARSRSRSIGRSFPHPGDDEKIREIFRAALKDDALDIQPRLEDGQIRYGFPVSVLVAER